MFEKKLALTEGREPICPRTQGFAHIYHRFEGLHRANREIPKTLGLLEALETNATPEQRTGNWRWESLLYRGYYDAYVQRKLAREQQAQDAALAALRRGGTSDALVKAAKGALDES